MVREAGFEPADSYESGYHIHMTSSVHVILSPPPLAELGNSRMLWPTTALIGILLFKSLVDVRSSMVGRAGFEPATFEACRRSAMRSRCKRDIIAGLD
jgi:hypothetical protein